MPIITPSNQKRLTNIAIVRLKSHGKRFEIACYKNKVLNWRDGIEKDLDEVIQTDTVFENVGKGIIAKEADILKVFKTKDLGEVCREILKKGDLQVSDKEREVALDGIFRDIVQFCVERCVHAQTGRQLTPQMVDNALKSTGFSVCTLDHTAKKQSLKAIEHLCSEMPESFARAKMRLRIVCPEGDVSERVRQHLLDNADTSIEEDCVSGAGSASASRAFTFVCDPRQYRELDALATGAGEGVSLQIVTSIVLREATDVRVGSEFQAATPGGEHVRAGGAEEPTLHGSAKPRGGYGGTTAPAAAKKGISCSACGGVSFEIAAEYRTHCKSEWHNHNLKLKVRGMPPVSEDDFAEMGLDATQDFRAVV